MRGADTYTEGLFTLKKLDDFVPENHPLRVIRTMGQQGADRDERIVHPDV